MSLFFIYSLKVALCLAAFYLLYKLLLSRDTFFGFNRAAILGMAALSLLLPLAHVSAGVDISVFSIDTDADIAYYAAYKDKLYAIATNYPKKLIGTFKK